MLKMRHVLEATFISTMLFMSTLASNAASAVWYSEFVVVRGQAELPCLVPDPPSETDRPLLVLWYKQDQSQVPIYSYDSRNGPFADGHRWADKTYLGERAFFRINSDPPTLVIKEVKVSDQDLYTCRVEFKFRPNAITKVNLTVIVPAGPPLVLDSAGREVRGSVGPLEEGQRAHLTCRSVGGTPEPTLSWWRDGRRLKQSSGLGSGAVIESRISVEVTRQLHDATLSCQALNNNITEPSTTSLSVNVLLRPVSLELVQAEKHASAGVETELVCAARGSRPAAHITWWRGDVEMPEVQHTVMNNGNLTTGTVKFVPQKADDGQIFTCRAVNPEINHTPLEQSTTLTVFYSPEAALSLGKPLRADDIKEGDDVYFECNVTANPPVTHISWYHNGEALVSQRRSGLIMQGRDLVLQKVDRTRGGRYTCAAENSQGKGVSNPADLNVMYKPVCAAPPRRTQSVQKQSSAKVICEVEAYPPQVNFTWKFNGSSEGEALPLENIENHGTISALNYSTAMEQDFGTLLCWATNAIGRQKKPCVIHLVPHTRPPNLPSAPVNCSIANQSSEAIAVICSPADEVMEDDVIYVMEAWVQHKLIQNTTNSRPEWWVGGLQSGTGVRLSIKSASQFGTSPPVILEADIMKVAEKRMGPPEDIPVPPVIGAVIGGVGVVVLLLGLGLLLARYAPKCCASPNAGDRIPNTPPPHPRASDIPLTTLKCSLKSKKLEVTQTTPGMETFESCSSVGEAGSLVSASATVTTKPVQSSTATSVSGEEARCILGRSERTEDVNQFKSAAADGLRNNPDLVLGTDPAVLARSSSCVGQGGSGHHQDGQRRFTVQEEDNCFRMGRAASSQMQLMQQKQQQQQMLQQSPQSLAFHKPLQAGDAQNMAAAGPFMPSNNLLDRGRSADRFLGTSGAGSAEMGSGNQNLNQGKFLPQLISSGSVRHLSYQPKTVRQQTLDHEFTSPGCSSYSMSMNLRGQQQQEWLGSTSSSSLHDLSCFSQPNHPQAPSCTSPTAGLKFRGPPTEPARSNSGFGGLNANLSMEGRGNPKASVTTLSKSSAPVTHYATLGRKPILKNPLRTPLAVRTGVGDFLSGKHQESAV